MWGQDTTTYLCRKSDRIIPTRVGTRPSLAAADTSRQDHPHACGDKFAGILADETILRIIPTRVGTSVLMLLKSKCTWDHPHACGDKRHAEYLPSAKARIIPTRVGTRTVEYNLSRIGRDHPHACGDKRFRIFVLTSEHGSSPRVWGQENDAGADVHVCRIIPTRVGTRN